MRISPHDHDCEAGFDNDSINSISFISNFDIDFVNVKPLDVVINYN